MARGNGRMTIFLDDDDYRQFIQLFRQVVEDFRLECWNYCLMPNHYHATVRPALPNISTAMQQLNSRYAQWWNRRHATVGHVFQGRFKAQIVQRDSYALALARYVALNPVRARLVEHPEQWRWSSFAPTIGLRPTPPFLAVEATLALFGEGDQSTLQKRFADFVLAGFDDHADDRIRSNDHVLGDVAFRSGVRDGLFEPAVEPGLPLGQTGI
jgi:REP element-mobilizing transposase RayT